MGEVTGEMSGLGEVKPSQNRCSLFITNVTGVTGDEFSYPPSNPESDAMVVTTGSQFQKLFGTK